MKQNYCKVLIKSKM